MAGLDGSKRFTGKALAVWPPTQGGHTWSKMKDLKIKCVRCGYQLSAFFYVVTDAIPECPHKKKESWVK